VKPLDLVRHEIDLAIAKRNLDAISLLGGEPTLHPDIVDIVRYVKSKGLNCILLTNGVRFLRDGDLALLDALVRAGVDRFLVHIDSGQKHVHGDIDRARHRMFDLLDSRRVCYGLSLTLYPGHENELPGILKRFAGHPWFEGVLATLAFDSDHAFDAEAPRHRAEMGPVYAAMRDDLGVEPTAYLPSSTDDDEVAWLMYSYALNVTTEATFAMSPELDRSMKWLFRALKGHHFFGEATRPDGFPFTLLAAGLVDVALHPRRTADIARLLEGLSGRDGLRFQYAVIQQAPRWDAVHHRVQICWQCPDATIRNGRLVPVCIAGLLDPIDGRRPSAPPEVIDAVFRHLESAEHPRR